MTTIYVKSIKTPYVGLGFTRFDIKGENVTTIYCDGYDEEIQTRENMHTLNMILSHLGKGGWAIDDDGQSKETALKAQVEKAKLEEMERKVKEQKRNEDEIAAGHYRALCELFKKRGYHESVFGGNFSKTGANWNYALPLHEVAIREFGIKGGILEGD